MNNLDALDKKLKALRALRPLPAAAARSLSDWAKVELTYTSNAIEGNTLSRAETAVVLEKGLTVSGKPLKDHLEAINHAAAYDWILALAKKKTARIDETIILEIHRLILTGLYDDAAGRYRASPVRIAGSPVILPNAAKVPMLMREFAAWLAGRPKMHPVLRAAQAHYRLVTIHPFVDGNGRTARLLMNLLLMQAGFPPAFIRPKDRVRYLETLEAAQLGGAIEPFLDFIGRATERSLDVWLETLSPAKGKRARLKAARPSVRGALMSIGELAKRAGLPVATVRFWIKEGLLSASGQTPSGYQLFDASALDRLTRIRALKDKRLTLAEIKERLGAG